MSSSHPRNTKVGKLRPTQIVNQHGPGAIVDLPALSVVVAGLDRWHPTGHDRVSEPRLEAFVGATDLFRPPAPAPDVYGGVPAQVFPEWLVCPRKDCRALAHKDTFHWHEPSGEFHCQRGADRHGSNARAQAFPARFMTACPRGHLDDFPWDSWVHSGGSGLCGGPLQLKDEGRSGSANDLVVSCEWCRASRRMDGVFEPGALTACRGRRPWLGLSNFEAGCNETPRVLLRGASNAYFSIVASALSIPPYSDPVHLDIAPYVEQLRRLKTPERVISAAEHDLLDDLLERHSVDKVLAAALGEPTDLVRLRPDEYKAFLDPPEPVQPPHEFEVRRVDVPEGKEAGMLGEVRAATRLREVRALRGFTRIESGVDIGDLADVAELNVNIAPLGPRGVTWLPAVDLRGEGIFLTLEEQALRAWESKPEVAARAQELSAKYAEFQQARPGGGSGQDFPGMRYVLLHSLAHALIRRLCLNAGYSSSALRERIYSDTGEEAMAGLLIYTASSDSEGSLGGLVDQAAPEKFGAVLRDALQDAHLCAQDPLCGAGELGGAAELNGAACHACLLLAETSCEARNRFLDRAVLAETIGYFSRWFFRGA
ncbi:MAG: DUF1998 domain-containing protein [Acidimicrobiia bacterium]|nr:DUF1998 domain-containing protein [Acidimicrobiia bacterium]MYG59991.1 DUF1998 domain-containing protein [Acidimicrobiia bacterium]MYJ33681.1 DUF1998 domain-containing protein [Acidimicrobiia bacterium]